MSSGPSALVVRLAALLLAAAPLLVTGPLAPIAHAAPQAAVPVALPVGQKAEEWAEALAARGLGASRVTGLPASGPGVSLVDHKDYWEMTVRDWKGGTQTVNVAPCSTPEEREDLLFYASTLLGSAPVQPVVATAPVPVPVAAPVTTPASSASTVTTVTTTTTTVATAAAPTGDKAPARAAPTAAPAAAPTGDKAPARVAPAASSTGAKTTGQATTGAVPVSSGSAAAPSTTTVPKRAAPTGTGLWIAAGGGVGIRSAAGAVADFHADGGWYLTRDVRIGLGLGVRSAATLLEAGDGRTMGNVDLLVEGAWGLPLAPVTPYLGVYTGVGIRSFADAGEPVLTAPVPLLGGEVGVNVPLGQLPLQIAPYVRVQGDMRSIELRSAAGLTPISPVELRAGLALVYRPK